MNSTLTSFGLDLVGGLGQYAVADAQADAQRVLGSSRTAAENMYRQGENAKKAATAAYNAYADKAQANRNLEYLGRQRDAITSNYLRAADASQKGSVQTRLAAAEQLGALLAQQAWSGTGGSTKVRVQNAVRARTSLALADQAAAQKQRSYDYRQQVADLEAARYQSLSMRYSMAGLDLNKSVAPTVFGPSLMGSLLKSADFTKLRDGLSDYTTRRETQSPAPVAENSFAFNFANELPGI